MPGQSDGTEDLIKQFEEESDAFFDELLNDGGQRPPATAGPLPPAATNHGNSDLAAGVGAKVGDAASANAKCKDGMGRTTEAGSPGSGKQQQVSDIETEYALLSQNVRGSEQHQSSSSASPSKSFMGIEKFDMDDADDGNYEEYTDAGPAEAAEEAMESKPPEAPPAPADFTIEDKALREELVQFYGRWRPANLPNVNAIVEKYRGRNVSHLWAQLAIKYNRASSEAVELLARTLYMNSPFEHTDETKAQLLEVQLADLHGKSGSAEDAAELLRKSITVGAESGSDLLLRHLCFRGIPDGCGLRPKIWKVLLGHMPMARHAEWAAVEAERRALYAGYRTELLQISDDWVVSIREGAGRTTDLQECRDLLQEIKNDVDRTRRDQEYFQSPASKAALLAILFIYARLNPGVRYVQGMNEVAAVVLWVMSADSEHAESDAFWVFSELMGEIKEGFIEALDHTGEGIHAVAGEVVRLLHCYDAELAQHLAASELPPSVFVFRWCTLLFAQDMRLSEVARLWDSFIGDPDRFRLVSLLCVGVMLWRRDELLGADKQFVLAEVLQGAPKSSDFSSMFRRACAVCAFERREQDPPFPAHRGAPQFAALAQEAAAKATELARTLQENVAPAVSETANQVSAVAADGVQALQVWLEETAPARQEALEQTQTQISSLWDSVRSNTHRLANEYGESDEVKQATERLSGAADSAVATASTLFQRAAMAFSK